MPKGYLLAVAERACKTAAQVAGSLIVLDQVTSVLDVDWAGIGSAAGLAALASVLTSIASSGFGNSGPSLTTEAIPPARPAVKP